MNFNNLIRELDNLREASARFLKINDRIPAGEDARKYFSIKDWKILDRRMIRCYGFGLDGPPPFIRWP